MCLVQQILLAKSSRHSLCEPLTRSVLSIFLFLCQLMRALIDILITFQMEALTHILDTKQPKVTESSTLQISGKTMVDVK